MRDIREGFLEDVTHVLWVGSESHLGVEGKEELSSQDPGEVEDGKDPGGAGRGILADAAESILHLCPCSPVGAFHMTDG